MRIPITIYEETIDEGAMWHYRILKKKYNIVEITNIGGYLYFKYTQNA